jgi:hypothetical protein
MVADGIKAARHERALGWNAKQIRAMSDAMYPVGAMRPWMFHQAVAFS